jgi:hypothetical protein
MNTKQKIITVIVLAAFLATGLAHMFGFKPVPSDYGHWPIWARFYLADRENQAMLPHILTPWVMLAVTYAALMALAASRKGDK